MIQELNKTKVKRRIWKDVSINPSKKGVYERKNGSTSNLVERQYYDGRNWYSEFNGLWWNKDFSQKPWRELKN